MTAVPAPSAPPGRWPPAPDRSLRPAGNSPPERCPDSVRRFPKPWQAHRDGMHHPPFAPAPGAKAAGYAPPRRQGAGRSPPVTPWDSSRTAAPWAGSGPSKYFAIHCPIRQRKHPPMAGHAPAKSFCPCGPICRRSGSPGAAHGRCTPAGKVPAPFCGRPGSSR